jgi:hypothetical protein
MQIVVAVVLVLLNHRPAIPASAVGPYFVLPPGVGRETGTAFQSSTPRGYGMGYCAAFFRPAAAP